MGHLLKGLWCEYCCCFYVHAIHSSDARTTHLSWQSHKGDKEGRTETKDGSGGSTSSKAERKKEKPLHHHMQPLPPPQPQPPPPPQIPPPTVSHLQQLPPPPEPEAQVRVIGDVTEQIWVGPPLHPAPCSSVYSSGAVRSMSNPTYFVRGRPCRGLHFWGHSFHCTDSFIFPLSITVCQDGQW